MQDLGRPDPVQDLHAEAVVPSPVQLLRQRLPGGDAQAQRREVVPRLGFLDLEHRRIERRNAEEERGPMAMDQLEHGLRQRPMRIEHALPAHAHREVHVVAEAVREEELRRRDRLVALRHPEHLQRVGVRAVHHVVLQVHGSLRPSRWSPRSRARTRIVLRRLHRLQPRRRLADPLVEADLPGRRPAGHHDVLEMTRLREHGPRLGQQRLGDDGDGRAAVLEEVEVVLGPHHRVHRNGNGADLDRAPERGEELRRVEEQAEDALLALDAEIEERIARAVDELLEPAIRERACPRSGTRSGSPALPRRGDRRRSARR